MPGWSSVNKQAAGLDRWARPTVQATGSDPPEAHAAASLTSVSPRKATRGALLVPAADRLLGPAGLSPHAQRKQAPNWAEKEVSRVLLRPLSWTGQTAIHTQGCPVPPNTRPWPSTFHYPAGSQHLAGLGPTLVGPEAVHGPAGEGNTPPPHRQRTQSLTWKSYKATMFSCFNS